VFYTPWCDEQGMVIDDGTVARLDEQRFRWTSAEPSLRWITQNTTGLRVSVEEVSEATAALALQGPMAARVLRACTDADVDALKYFHRTPGRIAGMAVDISRTGYTGDLGYELWIPSENAVRVWDALMAAGQAFELKPVGMLALDVARTEAGLLLLDVDYVGSRKALIPAQRYTPFEMALSRLVSADKGPFVGRAALIEERRRGPRRKIVGLEIEWAEVEALFERIGLTPVAPAATSRVAVPIFRSARQIGRATTTAWSPTLKRLIALATIDAPHYEHGTRVQFEITVEGARHFVGAKVVPTPFFNPSRKTATPPL
jgi:aminomethyltransferase